MLVYEGAGQAFSESFAAAVLSVAVIELGLRLSSLFGGILNIAVLILSSVFASFLLFHAFAQFYNGRKLRSEAKSYSELIDAWIADLLDEDLPTIESLSKN